MIKLLEIVRSFKLTKWVFPAAIIAISILATLDSGHLPTNPIRSDKVNHILAFGVLTLILLVSYPKISLLKKLSILIGYGILLELIQLCLPWRSGDIADLVADAIGIILATGMWEIISMKNAEGVPRLQEE